MKRIKLMRGDCLELMSDIPDGSIDMILCDLPYGTTACKWDAIIPFKPLWEQYKRIIKSNGAIALFGSEPFSSKLRMSNLKWFKYDWVWIHNRSVNFAQAPYRPLGYNETISIFSGGGNSKNAKIRTCYYPQGLAPCSKILNSTANREHRPSKKPQKDYIQTKTGYPTNLLMYNKEHKPLHPTQKPVALLEYLIKTYTIEGETVLDNCMGSGSTGVACLNLGRKFIGIEQDDKYFKIARERIANHVVQTKIDLK